MRRALLAALPLLLLLGPAASAAPGAAPERGAQVAFALRTVSGSYVVTVLASQPLPDGAPQLRVEVGGSDGTRALYGELPAAALTDPAGSPVLSASVAGVPLRVRWHPDPVVLAGSSRYSGDDEDLDGWTVSGHGGVADVQLGAVRCRTDDVVVGPALVAGGAAFGSPLRTGLGLSLRGGRCGSVPPSDLPLLP